MGAYRSVIRPAAFLLPPEPAHAVAGWVLRLPLPWGSLSGGHAYPALRTDLAGIPLLNPIGLAAGFDKNAGLVGGLSRLGFGYLVVGTVTRNPRRGNPRPRIVRRPETESLVNAMGLPNKGAVAVAERLRRTTARRAPVVVSLADEDVADVVANHELFEPLCAGIELNASCPNVSWGRDRGTEDHVRDLLRALRERSKPLFVKLPPYRSDPEREAILALARLSVEEGADGLTCFNSLKVPEPRLSVGAGGLTGHELLNGTIRGVGEVVRATGGTVPVNACGGITRGADAVRCFEAGATTVQMYTGLIYEGPGAARTLARELARTGVSGRSDWSAPVAAAG